jgi:outer membrane protein OmpA-like peptidoglycan-associated protein
MFADYRITVARYVWMFMLICGLSAQTGKDSVFGDVEKMLMEAKEQGAELLAPTIFAEAMTSFNEANEMYIKNKSTRDIKTRLDEAQRNCSRAMDVIKRGKIALKTVIQSRENALSAEARVYADDIYMQGEKQFSQAVREAEREDLEEARDIGSRAEEFFRSAELKAIKDKMLTPAREMVNQGVTAGVEKYAPQTFFQARDLLNQVENLLTKDRYARDQAQAITDQCIYQTKHAIFLADEIKGLMKDPANWEKLIIRFENILAGLTTLVGENPYFDTGMQPAINIIGARLKELKSENERLLAETQRIQSDYKMLQEKESLSSAELAKKRDRDAKFEKVKSIFTPREAKVLDDGENMIIRLQGLFFPGGKAVIQPEYFSLLSKVMEALKIFPNKHIILEGHTDSKGTPLGNKLLSENRAIAVREYVIANMGKNRDEITAIGYGSARPVASNEDEEGRAQNNRIDIVINLNK